MTLQLGKPLVGHVPTVTLHVIRGVPVMKKPVLQVYVAVSVALSEVSTCACAFNMAGSAPHADMVTSGHLILDLVTLGIDRSVVIRKGY
ncbi:hypothetical protein ElyMa_002633800 [Elysia marginata]|uniref:Uncharacterized protein n=1 Tax=Elysia marginata TaxID=1093978 RepID=A0AAV4H911_9GAST|nr:hypothetical protein ElyMa_002633800 [Elysia marginata]